ncbi:MAG: MBL fold metallo-hydrolase [Rhodospirillaceae bacterium]|nr:MBL fold metallo-hydrolase [Rhodospirillaceae bacterium]
MTQRPFIATPVLAALVLIALAFPFALPNTAQAADREITKITGDLYRFKNKFHFSVFLVTPEGVIATDPINKDAAAWLKAEIAKRFGKEIRYVIYSHDHRDHIAGGEVFAETATVVAHQNAKAAIVGEKRPTAVPTVTFSDRMTVELGGKRVELTYVGPSHSNNMIVMNFPEERVLFLVDLVSPGRVPYKNLSDSYFPGWIDALKKVEAIDFDILAPGHGPMTKKSEITSQRQYLEELYAAVLSGIQAGKTLDELKASVTMVKYKSWGMYKDWRPLNIEGVYSRIQAHRRGN